MGAEVVRIDRKAAGPGSPGGSVDPKLDILTAGRPVALDLKRLEAVGQAALKLIEPPTSLSRGSAWRQLERLGFDPEVCLKRNPLVLYMAA